MFRLNLKIALRNLLKNKVYAAINIIGLSLGLTACVLLMLYVNHEESYDTWSAELQNVYQVRERHDFSTPDNKQHWQEANDSRMASLLKEKLPRVQAATRVDQGWSFNDGFSVKIDGKEPVMVKGIRDADSSFFHVFPYEFLLGDEQKALQAPNSVVIKQSLAKKLFGTDRVLGKSIKVVRWRTDKGTPLTITGVVANPKTPQSVNFEAIMRSGNRDKDPEHANSTSYCQVYARLSGGTPDSALLNQTVQKIYVDYKKASFKKKGSFNDYYKDGKKPGLKLLPLADVHSNPPLEASWFDKSKPIIGISIFLLLVSIVNFVNLATAQSVQRAKEVGVKKVLGAYKRQLILQFLIESAIQSLISVFLSIILIEILLPAFNQQFNVQLSFWYNPYLLTIILQLLALFALVTLLAGFYPAWVLSGYSPVAVLKGNYESGLRGVALRNILVIFQFVISITFIIAIGVMHLQTSYMDNKDLGFERSKLININTNYEDDFAMRLKRIPGVQYVGTTTQVLGNAFNVPEEITYQGNKININTVTVTMDALPALGVKVLEGRIFSPEYKQDTVNTVVFNEAAAKLLGNHVVGKNYDIVSDNEKYNFQIVGVIKNYHNEGFDKEVLPTVYKVTQLGGTSNTNNLLLRLNTENSAEIMKKVEVEWNALYPDFPMSYTSLDDTFKKMLEDNKRFMDLIILFSLISVSISLLGLFALSTFVAKRRTKEIAIRKILGASDLQIINMLNRSFLILVLVANLVSWPVAYIITARWLQGYAYRIDMPVLPFIIAAIISTLIAVLTVSTQARKAAVSNPVDSLKYE